MDTPKFPETEAFIVNKPRYVLILNEHDRTDGIACIITLTRKMVDELLTRGYIIMRRDAPENSVVAPKPEDESIAAAHKVLFPRTPKRTVSKELTEAKRLSHLAFGAVEDDATKLKQKYTKDPRIWAGNGKRRRHRDGTLYLPIKSKAKPKRKHPIKLTRKPYKKNPKNFYPDGTLRPHQLAKWRKARGIRTPLEPQKKRKSRKDKGITVIKALPVNFGFGKTKYPKPRPPHYPEPPFTDPPPHLRTT